MTNPRTILIAGATIAFLCVLFGAFGAHALKQVLGDAAKHQYDLGVRYAFIHAIAIMIAGLAMPMAGNAIRLSYAVFLFIAGVLLFSGSLILLALSGVKYFAFLTPLGGLSFLLAWLLFIFSMKTSVVY